jgi:Phosphotransferase enzyme family
VRSQLAPIELVHPDGAPRGTAVIGDEVPQWLIPADARGDGDADVVLVSHEHARAEAQVLERLSDDGIVIALGARPRVAAALAERGIAHAEPLSAQRRGHSVAISVGGSSSRLQRMAWSLHPASSWAGATVLRRDARAPLAGWLPGSEALVQVRTSWRGSGESALVSRADAEGRPTVYAKVGLGEATADIGTREVSALTALRDAAQAAGARVPEAIGLVQVCGRPAALLSAVEGEPAAKASRTVIDATREEAVAWLMRFTRRTQVEAPAHTVIEGTVLHPATVVVERLDGGTAYLEHLRRLATAVGDGAIGLSAAHGDLTLWNVLAGKPPGILDWAGASKRALPLVDLPYLLVDASYWRSRRRNRVGAFRRCFPDNRMTVATDVPEPVLELAFHACWLGHAANEHGRRIRGPFTDIVRTIVQRAAA